ncbi:hypothetical protein Xaut_2644 [Xanthobacter versatilis]|uniref:Uncharacterized protein n=1 Tax=Xanthobacter autotrophicus (strain ATCC BAA-1158 / Py2) TaxID=78245 RepID=A7IIP3_XANP2|nr:hypothetical protein Xaut_2644 [Xanthobacter autotrophicus Py2]
MNRTDLAAPRRLRSTTVALGLGLACLLAWTGAATALMPPYVYENARNDAKSVIVIAVDEVAVTPHPFGTCTVTGTVKKVERGTTYSTGQKVELGVPCAKPNASPPLGGTIYQDVDRLKASRFGRAYLDAAGQVVLSQYEQLATAP